MAAKNLNGPRQCLLTVKEEIKDSSADNTIPCDFPTSKIFIADIEFLDEFGGRINNAEISILDKSIFSDKIKPGAKLNAEVSGKGNEYLLKKIC